MEEEKKVLSPRAMPAGRAFLNRIDIDTTAQSVHPMSVADLEGYNPSLSLSMSTEFRREKSLNGLPLTVLKSALQKYIRRGILNKALFCAGELDLFAEANNFKEGERIRTNFFHRLMIIFMEDIGNGNYHLWPIIADKLRILQQRRNRIRADEVRLLKEVVTMLCCSEKSRLTSCLEAIGELKRSDIPPNSIFTEVLQQDESNSVQGLTSALSRRSIDSVIHASRIWFANNENCPNFAKYRDLSAAKRGDIIFDALSRYVDTSVARSWFKDLSGHDEQYLTWMLPLAYFLYGSPPLHGTTQTVDPSPHWTLNILQSKHDRSVERISITEDYVYDGHTRQGQQKGRGLEYFLLESSTVIPESISFWPRDLKNFHKIWRLGRWSDFQEHEFIGDWRPKDVLKVENKTHASLMDAFLKRSNNADNNLMLKGKRINEGQEITLSDQSEKVVIKKPKLSISDFFRPT